MSKTKSSALLTRPVEYDDAIITSYVRYGDADCIARLFCLNRGRISAFAKKGLAPSKTRGSIIQAPARAKVGLIGKGEGLARLAEVEIDSQAMRISENLKAFAYAAYLAEIVEIFVPEQEPAPDVFFWLSQALGLLLCQEPALLLRAFELKLLQHAGLLPDLREAVDCPLAQVKAYDPVSGHLLSVLDPQTIAFDAEAQRCAIALLEHPLDALPSCAEAQLRMVGRIFAFRLRAMRLRPLKSLAFFKDLEA